MHMHKLKIKNKTPSLERGCFVFYLRLKRACANSYANAYVSADARYKRRQVDCIEIIADSKIIAIENKPYI